MEESITANLLAAKGIRKESHGADRKISLTHPGGQSMDRGLCNDELDVVAGEFLADGMVVDDEDVVQAFI